jgi:amino acid transporter
VITLPRLIAGLVLTAGIGLVNYRGIRTSGRFQDIATLGLLACFAVFVALGFARGSAANVQPLFAPAGPFLSILLVAQIVPYFMTGFESIPKASEEARADLPPAMLARTIIMAVLAGGFFYVVVIGVVSWVYPWTDIVSQHLGTETAFARAFGSQWIARLILAGALLSLFKIFNGNLVAATRLLYALGRRGLVHSALGTIDKRFGTPSVAIALVAVLTAAAAFLGDALLVPITEVGSAVVGVGWCASCLAFLMLAQRNREHRGRAIAAAGAIVGAVIVLMKVIPGIPGSFTAPEWLALAGWCILGFGLWSTRTKTSHPSPVPAPTSPSAPGR